MRRTQDVFLFTLIDLLLQLLFVGVVFWALLQQRNGKQVLSISEQQNVQRLREQTGYSTITELTDVLSRLAPLPLTDSTLRFVRTVGGIDSVRSMKRMIDSIRAGTGLPPCDARIVNGRRRGIPHGRLIASDDSIRVVSLDPTLLKLMPDTRGELLRTYSFAEFRSRFESLAPGSCWHYIEVVEKTNLIFARDVIGRIFARVPVK